MNHVRQLVLRERRPAQLADLVLRHQRALDEDDAGAHQLPQHLIRDTDDSRISDRGKGSEVVLNFSRMDTVSSANDQVALATVDSKITLIVQSSKVARLEQAFCGNGVPRRDRLPEVPCHQVESANGDLSLRDGAVSPWSKSRNEHGYYMQILASVAEAYEFDLDVPWHELPRPAKLSRRPSIF